VDAALVVNSDLALLAERRAGLAALLGLLLLEEPGPAVADLVRTVPSLAALGRDDPAMAVEYERVFLRGVPLYESGFRSDDGQHGGPALGAVVERFDRAGFTEQWNGRWRVAGADHLGLELRCYSALCSEEAVAWRDDTADAAMRAVEAERGLLADHLSAWAPVAIRAALEVAGDGVYRPLLEAVSAFLAEEHERLRPAPALGAPIEVPSLPQRLGPARLARLLLAPATCGTWLLTTDIEKAALAIGTPWRRSDTRTALRHVIEEAVDSGELATVLTALRPAVAKAHDAFAAVAITDGGAGAHWTAWATRAEMMLALIDQTIEEGRLGAGEQGTVAETLVIIGQDGGALADMVDRVVTELRAAGLRVEREPGTGHG